MKSPTLDRRLLAGRVGLGDAAGPRAKNTTPPPIDGTQPLWTSGPEAPARRRALPQLKRQ